MKYVVLIFFLGWYSLLNLHANDTITDLVCISEIQFNSDLEKEVFHNYFNTIEKDYFALFMVVDSTQTISTLKLLEDEYKKHLQQFESPKFQKKPPRKRVKALYSFIHETYFTDYKFISYFNEIFSNGNFNCVTASALYTIYMNDLNIPFVVKETPVHVYLIAYPGEYDIFVETTDPENRVFNYDYRTKTGFIYHLINKDIVSEDLLRLEGIDALFRKYFYSDESISIDELVGIHYMNHAAYLLDNKKSRKAFDQLEKAYLFYPNEKLRFILFTALATIIVNNEYAQPNDFMYLCRLERYKDFDVTNQQILEEFLRATNIILGEDEDMELYAKAYDVMKSNLKDSTLMLDISFIYHYNMGRFYLSAGNMETGLYHVEQSYAIQPANAEALSLFIAAVTLQIRGKNEKEMFSILTTYQKKFPDLFNNPLFKGLLLECYLLNVTAEIEIENEKMAIQYLKYFETEYQPGAVAVSKDLTVQAYSKMAVYYFKMHNMAETKRHLQKGLSYVPDSRELQYRLEVID